MTKYDTGRLNAFQPPIQHFPIKLTPVEQMLKWTAHVHDHIAVASYADSPLFADTETTGLGPNAKLVDADFSALESRICAYYVSTKDSKTSPLTFEQQAKLFTTWKNLAKTCNVPVIVNAQQQCPHKKIDGDHLFVFVDEVATNPTDTVVRCTVCGLRDEFHPYDLQQYEMWHVGKYGFPVATETLE